MFGLERLDFTSMRQRQADVVKTVEHAMFAMLIDVEGVALTRRRGHCLLLKVHRQPVPGVGISLTEQLVDNLRIQFDQ